MFDHFFDFAAKQLHFLIATHLGRAVMPFPIPPGFPRAGAKSIALAGFNAHGRRAQFAGCFDACIAGFPADR